MKESITTRIFLGFRKRFFSYPRIYAAARSSIMMIQSVLRIAGITWPDPTPYLTQLRKIANRSDKPIASVDDGKPAILVFTVRGWEIHTIWESLIGKGLEYRGWPVITFICGGWLPRCDFLGAESVEVPIPLCERCAAFPRSFLNELGLPYLQVGDFTNSEKVESARKEVLSLGLSELNRVVEEGVPVGDLVRASVQRALLKGSIASDPRDLAVYRAFVASGMVMVQVINGLLDRVRPGRILLMNGLFYSERILMFLAKQRGIPVVTYESSRQVDKLEFARNRPVVKYDFHHEWELCRDQPLPDTERKLLESFLEQRRKGNVGREPLWPSIMDEREQAIKRLGFDSLKPTATLFTNVLGDTSLFESDQAFSSQAAWIIETVRQFASRPGNRLIIRIHPSEVRLRGREAREPMIAQINGAYPELPNNISVIPPEDDISSYTLIDLSDLVLVYVSTIGLEAVLYGKNVIVAGKAHYIDKGFTLDVDDANRYGQLIDEGLAKPALEPMKKELAWRYSNLYFRRFPISFPLMSYRSWPIIRLNFKSLAALAPGGNEELDLICRFIVESTCEDRINLTH